MEETRFDALTKVVAADASTRRAAIKLLGGTVLSGALARLGLSEAAARCKKVGAVCRRSGECCTGAVCPNGRCRCRVGRQDCNGDGRCENLPTDPNNCGACGTRCPAGAFCQAGECLCPGDEPLCGGVCCPSGQECNGGTCGCLTPCGDVCCLDGETCCNGVCRNLRKDANACGSCDTSCGSNQVCQGGDCCIPPDGTGCVSNQDCCNFPVPAFCSKVTGVGVCKTIR